MKEEQGQTVYIVGQWVHPVTHCPALHGVFTTVEAADARCRDDSYFVGPVVLDAILPDEVTPWPGMRTPNATPAPEVKP